ncbi:spore germination protein [Paenibacillus sp. sgz302251]|uniref:spore germination protein n=1 Tax=Paenibacillus sp. sgz302251 TaxID=3414493 RepID=UPI003C7D0FAA
MSLINKPTTNKQLSSQESMSPQNWEEEASAIVVTDRLADNIEWITETLGNSTDLIVRRFKMGEGVSQDAAVLCMEGISDAKSILESLVFSMRQLGEREIHWNLMDAEDFVERLLVPVGSVKRAENMNALLKALLFGDTVFLFDGLPYGIIAGSRKLEDRGIQEPSNEPVVRGPRDGFIETLRTNTGLLRKRIKDPNLWMETFQIGRSTQTDVAVMYMKGIASMRVVNELRERLKEIDIDSVLESGYIEEFIQDKTFTLFPLVYTSERPDVISAELLEGRVSILVDGSPFALVVPAMFAQFMQASEDYYQRWDFATFIRIIRYCSLGITLLAPAIYVAITTFHQEVLPPQLLMSLAAAREGVPLPALVEAMIMEITFEILREAGVRMPKTIGQAMSIVGTLVIGQAAVEAGFISPAMVIVVSLTAISNFVLPTYSIAISFRLLRFGMILLAGTMGIIGILMGILATVLHLCSLRSFGIPYMSGFAPFEMDDQKDIILRLPRWMMKSRPRYTKDRNYVRNKSKSNPAKKN